MTTNNIINNAIAKLVEQGANISRIDFIIRVQQRQNERNQKNNAD